MRDSGGWCLPSGNQLKLLCLGERQDVSPSAYTPVSTLLRSSAWTNCQRVFHGEEHSVEHVLLLCAALWSQALAPKITGSSFTFLSDLIGHQLLFKKRHGTNVNRNTYLYSINNVIFLL